MRGINWYGPTIWFPFCIAIGVVLVLPHLVDAVWQDESYTLFNFSSYGFLYPFTDYHAPNNHILLSALLSQWWVPGDSIVHLRLPLLLAFLLSMFLLAWGTTRHFGVTAAMVATVFFAGSTISANFALQLRGYGLSWLFVTLMLWALPTYLSDCRWIFAVIYSFTGAALLALIPTNLIVCGVLIAWGWWLVLFGQASGGAKVERLVVITLGPMLGFVAYIGVWHQLLAASGRGYSDWGKLELVSQIALTFFADYWLFLPLVFAGIYYLLKEVRQRLNQVWAELGLVLALLSVPALFLFIMQHAPFPRNFVPLLPVICVVCGVLVAKGCAGLDVSANKGIAILGLLAGASLVSKAWLPCGQIVDTNRAGNLCQQYYQHNYQPETVMRYVLNDASARGAIILTGFEGLYALGFLDINYGLGVDIRHYKTYDARAQTTGHVRAPWIVTSGNENISSIINQLKLGAEAYVQVLDTGYFKLYRPGDRAE